MWKQNTSVSSALSLHGEYIWNSFRIKHRLFLIPSIELLTEDVCLYMSNQIMIVGANKELKIFLQQMDKENIVNSKTRQRYKVVLESFYEIVLWWVSWNTW